jgi:hypothetical protein
LTGGAWGPLAVNGLLDNVGLAVNGLLDRVTSGLGGRLLGRAVSELLDRASRSSKISTARQTRCFLDNATRWFLLLFRPTATLCRNPNIEDSSLHWQRSRNTVLG